MGRMGFDVSVCQSGDSCVAGSGRQQGDWG